MGKSHKTGFDRDDLLIEPSDRDPEIGDLIQQAIVRLLGWDVNNDQWRSIAVDNIGRLLVGSNIGVSDTANHSSSPVGTTSTLILAANSNRKSVLIQNIGSVAIALGFGTTAISATGIVLIPDAIFTDTVYTGAIYAISKGAPFSSLVGIEEFT